MTTRSLGLLFVGSFALALSSLAGCSAHVNGDPSGQHGDNISDDDSSSMSDGCGGDFEDPVNAIAIPLGTLEQFESTDGDEGSSSSGGGGGISPDTIVIQVANSAAYQCTAPTLSWGCGPNAVWELSFELAPSRVAPGTFDLSDSSLNAFYSFSAAGSGQDCAGGGGSFVQGQLVIDSVDETAIHFHLTGTNGNDALDGIKGDGNYVANRCGF